MDISGCCTGSFFRWTGKKLDVNTLRSYIWLQVPKKEKEVINIGTVMADFGDDVLLYTERSILNTLNYKEEQAIHLELQKRDGREPNDLQKGDHVFCPEISSFNLMCGWYDFVFDGKVSHNPNMGVVSFNLTEKGAKQVYSSFGKQFIDQRIGTKYHRVYSNINTIWRTK